MRKHLLGLALLFITGPLMIGSLKADVVQLVDNHPDRHVVVKGDTLWDISSMFLKSPWLWPKVWSVNPQIDNPHLIYPGDVIYLVWVNGQPQLRMDRGPRRLGPQIRRSDLEQAIQTIPLQDIKSFLSDNLVLQKDELEKAPYVLAGVNERIISGAGDKVYARGELPDVDQNYYGIYRPARIYKDPETEEVLGYESKAIGGGYLVANQDDIMTISLKRTYEEVRVKDRVLPTREEVIQSVFYPRAPEQEVNGKILSVLRGVTQIGQYDVVAINRGEREGIKTGHVLHVYRKGEVVKDPVTQEMVTLPSERGGTIMVFKVFDKVSYALVMRALNAMSLLDEVRTPK
ncbi:MAG: LysM peptidoglycan-binding domain-containing protein [Motiliproteus sp.]|nr:LysM peptidoglycan-binding domain-containing protein [Motiliproteus sp.]MCW9052446.1 LysM peptidoglycan-binding domain-containing protein [Motiliproteus sp.]